MIWSEEVTADGSKFSEFRLNVDGPTKAALQWLTLSLSIFLMFSFKSDKKSGIRSSSTFIDLWCKQLISIINLFVNQHNFNLSLKLDCKGFIRNKYLQNFFDDFKLHGEIKEKRNQLFGFC